MRVFRGVLRGRRSIGWVRQVKYKKFDIGGSKPAGYVR